MCCCPHHIACSEATGHLEVCEEMGDVRQGAAESLEGALVPDPPTDVAALSMHSPWTHGKKAHFFIQIFILFARLIT